MIVLDTNVLSAFTRLGLIPLITSTFTEIFIPESVKMEFSKRWGDEIFDLLIVLEVERTINDCPGSLSQADIDVVEIGISKNLLIASDDLTIRKFARSLDTKITGSLGILRQLYKDKKIDTFKEYKEYVFRLSDDVYMTKGLIEWALDVETEK